MNKYLLLFLCLIFSTSTYAKCDSGKVIAEILAAEGAIIQKNQYQSQFFFPVVDATVSDKTLWVRTYGSDFSPVEIQKNNDAIELLKVRFPLHLKGMSSDEPSFKVKDYQGSRIFIDPQFEKKCNFDGRVDLVVKKLSGSIEKSEFNVYRPIRMKKIGSPISLRLMRNG